MNNLNHTCESIQEEISLLLDDGHGLTTCIANHIAFCEDCAGFCRLCSGDIAVLLAEPLPPPGIILREKILSLPELSASSRVGYNPLRTASASRQGFLSALAAAIVIGFCGYWLIDVRPLESSAINTGGEPLPAEKLPVERELASIEKDFQQGLSELQGPVRSLQSILNR